MSYRVKYINDQPNGRPLFIASSDGFGTTADPRGARHFDTEEEAEEARLNRYHPGSWETEPVPGSKDDRPVTYRREKI